MADALSLEIISLAKFTLQKMLCGEATCYDVTSQVKYLDIWTGGSGRLFNDVASTEAAVSLNHLRFEHTSLERYGLSQLDRQSAALDVPDMMTG
jgi:hypothetical protein